MALGQLTAGVGRDRGMRNACEEEDGGGSKGRGSFGN